MADYKWDENRRAAAQLIAEGELSDTEIAARVGVSRQILWVWRKDSEFTAAIEQGIESILGSLRRRRISHVEQRIDSLNTRWLKLHRVIEARSTDPEMLNAAGGETGLLVRTQKALGGGEFAQIVDEFAVDTGLLKELREIEKQASIELKQWTEKADVTSLGQAVAVQVYLPTNGRDQAEQPGAGDLPGEPG